ncbi:MAG: flagellar hook-length control protein FliK, partial [Eubacterium sp.]|nr:flagellar hook-length control protein FliK [Eubacterium sp.]
KRLNEVEEAFREKAEEIAADSRLASAASRAFASGELPITEKNITDFANAADKALGVRIFDDASLKYMATNHEKVTPQTIQESLYGAGTVVMGKENPYEAADQALGIFDDRPDGFDEVVGQIEKRLEIAGVQADETSLSTARWLYQNDLPVTPETIVDVDTVKELREMDPENLLARIVSEMEDGALADAADLSNLSRGEVKDLIDNLVSTDDATLKRAYPTEKSLATARRQLEEIRLTMTISSAREMTKLGVKIDIENLEQIVDELKNIEESTKKQNIYETGLEPTEKNVQILTDTTDAAKQVLASPVELLSLTFEKRAQINLLELSDEGKTLAKGYADGSAVIQKDVFRALENTYEAVGTQVRGDLGDSIRKAFGNMGPMLDEIGLDRTAANERAVRILSYNRMEISVESVTEMKTYDAQVNDLMKSMKPQVVQKMIEEGINPLELSLSNLEKEVKRIENDVDADDVTFSRFLWKLDKQGEISAEERESMIGIYRLLDKIEKSDGAVIGQLVNEGRDLSMKNMLEAVRTRKTGSVDAKVDDENGSVSLKDRNGKTIDAQIMSAFVTAESGTLKKVLSPEALHKFAEKLDDASFDELAEFMEKESESDEEMASYYERMAEEVREVMINSDETVRAFLQDLDLPETVKNMISASDYMKSVTRTDELWEKDEEESVVDAFDEPEKLDEVYENIEKTHLEKLENIKNNDDISFDRMKEVMKMAGSIAFYQAARRHQMYEVPVMTDKGMTFANITIRDGASREKGTVDISLNSEELGKVMASFKLRGTKVDGFVTVENTESMDVVRQMLDGFEKDLGEYGFTMEGNSLVAGSRNSLLAGKEPQGAKNTDLYRVAKCFLQNM